MTNRKARTALMLIWTFSLAVASPVLVFRKHKVRMWKNHVESWCDDDWPVVKTFDSSTNQTMLSMPGRTYYYTFVSVVLYFYPMLAMTIAYSIIIRKLKLSTMPGERLDKGVAAQQKTKRKVIAMLAAILSVFGICWMPYQIILLYSEWRTNRESLPDWFFSLHFAAACMADSNSALNPIIYAGFNENFKQGILEIFRVVTCRRKRSRFDPKTYGTYNTCETGTVASTSV
ncbi:hypothetical protein ACJMK2_034776 [Sinanodonta woodiana]|uniref:G-protein coupled receptors family 1 profile domain-containing protein n=1 Tax=Sinanodonta woodiana TaxID=1069815 RepID=A0ABD3WU04_SINWO